ncbi:D-arabinono-1,4-lactone oxidase [Compostimonas suwonensis]|uniref:Xylitol oxidase n=1 Tax=Compostimonas suwonensis TaxID=1048394 RepID=A0A2M9C4M2_9MICO|nr:D-arabinono-1,4-lactone oxidase [Compostimonas suwonensis]PJJ65481.1 xylitol oxidase [Compostimonas suwonensis]
MAAELNWAGNYSYRAHRILRPQSVEQLQEIVAAGGSLRALGSRHSFNAIADTSGELIATAGLPDDIVIDEEAHTVTVGGGTKYGDLGVVLAEHGLALHNLASLPHISVAGAIATATHGSGDRNGNLSTAVEALEFVDGTGELRRIARGDQGFEGAAVSLGALGVVTRVTLRVEPSFEVRQNVFVDLPWERVMTDYDAITSSAYSVSLFTTWAGEAVQQLWLKERVDAAAGAPGAEAFGGRAATAQLHMISSMSPDNTTDQLGVAGPWNERLAHFKYGFTPSAGEEIQSEYLLPREHAVAAFAAVRGLAGRIAPLLQISEIRTVAADELWLSSSYQQETVGLHFTWRRMQDEVEAFLPTLEGALAPFGARPHWGKVFHGAPGLIESLYPRLGDFRELAAHYDPRGVFRNEFLERHVFS